MTREAVATTDAAPLAERYGGLENRVELDISGMTCAACANRIEKKLNKLDGVRATVNYATERAVVLGLPPERASDAVSAVVAAGYGASEVVEGEEPDGYSDRVKLLRNRLIVAAFLTIPLGDVAIVLALAPQMRFPGWQWVLIACALPVVLWSAWPFHRAAWRNLRHGTTSMDTLVSLGVIAAFTWSVVSTTGPIIRCSLPRVVTSRMPRPGSVLPSTVTKALPKSWYMPQIMSIAAPSAARPRSRSAMRSRSSSTVDCPESWPPPPTTRCACSGKGWPGWCWCTTGT